MADGWELLLDVLELPNDVRERAELEVLECFHNYDSLSLDVRPRVKEYIHKLLGTKDIFTMIKPYREAFIYEGNKVETYNYFYHRTISLDEMDILAERWKIDGGEFIIILKGIYIPKEEEKHLGDEELIGRYLQLHRRLLLKAPDGNALLYLYINE